MDADRVVVELIAKVDNFDGKVVQSATQFDAGMKRIEASATRAEQTVGRSADAQSAAIRRESAQISQAARVMGSQLNDIGALLQSSKSPFVVPVKQAPAVSRSLSLISSGAAALGGVIGGVLAAAVLGYVASLAAMILKQDDAGKEIDDLVEKLKEQARQSKLTDAAQEEFGHTIEGVTKALDDQEKALEKASQADRSAAFQAAVSAEKQRLYAVEIRKNTVALIEQARAQLEVLKAQAAANGSSLRETGVGAEVIAIEGRLKTLQAALGVAQSELKRAEDHAREFLSRAAVERGGETEVDAIKRKYDRLVETTRKRLVAEGAVTAEIVKQTAALRAQQRIDEEAARKKPKPTSGLPKVTAAEVRAVLESMGATTTSGLRSAQRNKDVGGAANSYHLSGQAIDFIPKGGMAAFDKEMFRLAFEARGIKVLELLGPGDKDHADHGHVAFSKTRLGPDQVAAAHERQARVAEAAADAEERRSQAYENELANMQGQEIDARQALITSAEEIAKLELAAIEISRQKYNDNLASLVETNKLHQDEAAELQKINDERAKLRAELVQRREDERRFRLAEAEAQQRLAVDSANRQAQGDLLQGQLELARTQKERRDLETRLLELQYKEEKARNQYLIDYAERLKLQAGIKDSELIEAEAAAALARIRLAQLEQRQGQDQQKVNQGTQGPLESFFGDIPGTADEINEALESIAAGGLATFTDALTDAIVNWRGFGNVAVQTLRSVAAGIIKLGIQQLLLHTIGKLLGTTATAATAAQASAAAAAWAPAAALASLATLGANAGPAAAAIGAITALTSGIAAASSFAGAAGFASGGYTGNGPIGAAAGIVHGQEFVFDAASTRRIGVANLEALRGGVRPSNAAAVAPRGVGGGLTADAMAQLHGVVGEAIRAMPPINVFPTFDPVKAMEAALDTRAGRQVMAKFMGDNRGTMTGQLTP